LIKSIGGTRGITPNPTKEGTSDPMVTEPFGVGRGAARVLFDLGAMLACMKDDHEPVLDFGAGTGWLSEFLLRQGYDVVAFDIAPYLESSLSGRLAADARLSPANVRVATGDGHNLPLPDDIFGHIFCFDTLHHMHSYPLVLAEMLRVLKPGGRAIFVEPGATHSTSPETIAFLRSVEGQLDWIERDVVLEEIENDAGEAGFGALTLVPHFHIGNALRYSLREGQKFRAGDAHERLRSTNLLSEVNYDSRVIFYLDKPA
jgi:SAM-dependent methyltransferase